MAIPLLRIVSFSSACRVLKKYSSNLSQRITYTRKGSRSEDRHGHLKVNNREIPDLFSLVAQGDRAFRFFQRKNLWGEDGYFPTRMPVMYESDSLNTHEIISRGWYRGKERLKDTPFKWL